MKSQTFGTEIEMRMSRKRAAQIAASVLGGQVKHLGGRYDVWATRDAQRRPWKMCYDSSIRANRHEDKCELVTPICTWDDLPTLKTIVQAIAAEGAETDNSCGIHVHVGAQKHTPQTIRNLVNLVATREELLYAALDVDPHRKQTYCKPTSKVFFDELNAKKPKTFEDLARIWYGTDNWEVCANTHYHDSRYRLLNLHAIWQKGTVEFRAFNSTTDTDLIPAYITLAMAISHQALAAKSASSKMVETDNPAYTFRGWLLRLGLIGEEFATTRRCLLENLEGNAAFRRGSKTERKQHT